VTGGHGLRQDHECPPLIAPPQPPQRALRDDVVQEDGIDSATDQVCVWVHVVVVRNRDHTRRVVRCEQQVVGDRRAQRCDTAPTQIGQRANAIAIRRPHRQDLAKFEVGQGDRVTGTTRGSVLDPGEPDVEIAAFDGLIDAGPLYLNEARRPAAPPAPESARNALGDFDVEAAHARGVGGVGFDEGCAALGISTPNQHTGVRALALRGDAY